MLDTRRFFLKRSIRVCGGLATAATFPKALIADCKSDTLFTGPGRVFPPMHLGDCEMRQFSIVLHDNGVGVLSGQVATHFTHTKDVWHTRLRLCSRVRADPQQIHYFTDQTFNGPQMSEKDVPLFHVWQEKFTFNPALLSLPKVYLGLILQITNCC